MVVKASPYNNLNIDIIQVSGLNPRISNFEGEAFNTLVETIREYGIITPLAVNMVGDEYILIAGERRYRAAKVAGLYNVPCIVYKDLSADSIMKMQVIENTARVALTSIEEGLAIRNYIRKFPDVTKKDVATAFGLERTRAHKVLKIVELPEAVWDFIRFKKLLEGHAEAVTRLIGRADDVKIIDVAKQAISLTVAETRKLVNAILSPEGDGSSSVLNKVTERLSAHFGGTVTVKHKGKDKVELTAELSNGSSIVVVSKIDEIEDTVSLIGVASEVAAVIEDLEDFQENIFCDSDTIEPEDKSSDTVIASLDVQNIEEQVEGDCVEATNDMRTEVENASVSSITAKEVQLPLNSENNVCVVIDSMRGDPKQNLSLLKNLGKLCPSEGNIKSKHNVSLLVSIDGSNYLTKKGYCDLVTADKIVRKLCEGYDNVNVFRNYGTSEAYEIK